MKINWHVLAARCAAAHPHWPWEKVCAEIGRRKPARRRLPSKPVVARLPYSEN